MESSPVGSGPVSERLVYARAQLRTEQQTGWLRGIEKVKDPEPGRANGGGSALDIQG